MAAAGGGEGSGGGRYRVGSGRVDGEAGGGCSGDERSCASREVPRGRGEAPEGSSRRHHARVRENRKGKRGRGGRRDKEEKKGSLVSDGHGVHETGRRLNGLGPEKGGPLCGRAPQRVRTRQGGLTRYGEPKGLFAADDEVIQNFSGMWVCREKPGFQFTLSFEWTALYLLACFLGLIAGFATSTTAVKRRGLQLNPSYEHCAYYDSQFWTFRFVESFGSVTMGLRTSASASRIAEMLHHGLAQCFHLVRQATDH